MTCPSFDIVSRLLLEKKNACLVAGLTLAAPSCAEESPSDLIDRHIFGKMQRDAIPHAPASSDEEFLRRIYLDMTGRLPEPAVASKFLASKEPDKRQKLIDSLF